MNFAYGVIAAVGVLAAISLGLIAADPSDIIEPRVITVEEKPTACTLQWDPVCGVDGETYGNLCTLDAANVKLDYSGECMIPEESLIVEKLTCDMGTKLVDGICQEIKDESKPVEEKSDTFADHAKVTIGTVEQSGFSQDCVADGCYTPNTVTVDVGEKVTMTNTDTTGIHTFTSGTVNGFTPSPTSTFDSDILLSGDSFEWTPDTTGEVPYYCMLHTWMQGTIVVQEEETMKEVMEEETMKEVMEEETMKEVMEEETMKEVMEEETMKEVMEEETMKEVMEEETMKEVMEEETMKEVMEEETMGEVEETSESMALTISIPKGVGASGCETTLECYLPYEVTVAAGTTITWINDDSVVHTVTSGKTTEGTTGLFDSSIFSSGKSFEYTFTNAGTYDYFCNVHPWMAGIVNVS